MVAKAETRKVPSAERNSEQKLKLEEIKKIEKRWKDTFKKKEVDNKEFCKLVGGLVLIDQKTPKGVTTRIFVHDKRGRRIELEYFPGSEGMGPDPFVKVSLPLGKDEMDEMGIIPGDDVADPETGVSYYSKIITVRETGEVSALKGELKGKDPKTEKSRQHPLRGQRWVLERHPVEPDLFDTLKTVWAAYQHSKKHELVGGEKDGF